MTSLLGLTSSFRNDAPPLLVTVYSRADCGCCRRAKDVLEAARSKYRLDIQEVDVDLVPAHRERYGMEVPVVEIAGKVRFRGRVDPKLLDRLLRVEAPRR